MTLRTLERAYVKFRTYQRDVRAIRKGRIKQRLWNRAVTAATRAIRRKLYR